MRRLQIALALLGGCAAVEFAVACSSSSGSSGSPNESPDSSINQDSAVNDTGSPEATSGGDGGTSDSAASASEGGAVGDAAVEAAASASDATVEAGAPASEGGTFTTTAAPATGTVYGAVTDQNGNPVANVTVTVILATASGDAGADADADDGGATASATTDSTGTFSISGLPTGRASLTASAMGYFSTTLDTDVSSKGWQESVVIVSEGNPTTIGATGGTVTAGSASIAFPAGAYSANASVYAVWLTGTTLAASPGSLLFGDSNSPSNMVLGVLAVNVPSEPTAAATVTIAVPSGLTASDLALYDFDTTRGDWGASTAPTSVSGGYATFSVSHFSDYAFVQLNAPDSVLITSVSGTAATYTNGSTSGSITAGQVLPMGVTVNSGGVTVCTRVLLCGNTGSGSNCGTGQPISFGQVCQSLGSATYTRTSSGLPQMQPGSSASHWQYQDGRNAQLMPGQVNKYLIRTKTAVMGVRGTSATFDVDPCASNPSSDIDDIEVDEGDVDVTDSAGSFDIAAGQDAVGCEDCTAPATMCGSMVGQIHFLNGSLNGGWGSGLATDGRNVYALNDENCQLQAFPTSGGASHCLATRFFGAEGWISTDGFNVYGCMNYQNSIGPFVEVIAVPVNGGSVSVLASSADGFDCGGNGWVTTDGNNVYFQLTPWGGYTSTLSSTPVGGGSIASLGSVTLLSLASFAGAGGTFYGMEVDWGADGGAVLAADGGGVLGTIERFSNGSSATIASTDEGTGLTTDGTNVYWVQPSGDVNDNFNWTLWSAPIGAGTPRALHSETDLTDIPPQLATDGKNVYWVNVPVNGGQGVASVPVSGGAEVIISSSDNSDLGVFQIVSDGSNVYWVTSDGAVWRAPAP